MAYTYLYPRPALTVDCVVFGFDEGALKVLLVERGLAPFEGQWALPGGFVRLEETLDAAARRELKEETGVENVFLGRYGFFRLHKRDRYDIHPLLAPWSETLHIEKLSYKPFPSCRATHGPIQAALALFAREPVPAAQIDGVIVHVPPMSHELAGRAFAEGTNPMIAAQFSIPYAVAVAMLRDDAGLPRNVAVAASTRCGSP